MSAAAEGLDTRASRAKPRPAGRVCEHGWRPTRAGNLFIAGSQRPQRSPRRRAIEAADARPIPSHRSYKEAVYERR